MIVLFVQYKSQYLKIKCYLYPFTKRRFSKIVPWFSDYVTSCQIITFEEYREKLSGEFSLVVNLLYC